jgi:hypothetical protein
LATTTAAVGLCAFARAEAVRAVAAGGALSLLGRSSRSVSQAVAEGAQGAESRLANCGRDFSDFRRAPGVIGP